jgi:hypothetical protein
MGIILGVVQFILISYICVTEVKRKSPAMFLWATLEVMFGIMHLFSVITGESTYSQSILSDASLFVDLFCIMYIFVRRITLVRPWEMSETFSYECIKEIGNDNVNFIFVIYLISAFAMAFSVIQFSGGFMNSSWSSGRDYTATLDYANSNQVIHILLFSFGGVPLYCWIKGAKGKSVLCLLSVLFLTIVTRNRILVIPILVFFICLVVFKMEQLKIKYIFGAIIAAIVVIYLVYGLLVFRHYGAVSVFLDNFNLKDFFNKINTYIATGRGELGLRDDFYYFIKNNNNFDGFGKGATYIRMLLVYIPTRFSFGIKPDDFAVTMGQAVGMAAGGSTHPTLFGDCYANLGWFGIVLGGFWGAFCSWADRAILRFKKQEYQLMAYVLFSSMYVIIGRGSVYNAFFYIAWGVPLLHLLSYFHMNVRFTFGKKYT